MIKATNVTKCFGSKAAVAGISFSVGKGEVLGFLGPNGAGKSTTMRMVTGFLPLSGGEITINGCDIEKEPVKAKQFIGFLPENAPAYQDMSVAGFLDFAASIRGLAGKAKTEAIARAVKLCHLGNVINQSIDTLSKGYRHRVCFAQAILHDPPVLILDEPTDGLDPNQKHEMRELIREMGKTKAIIVSTHILEEVEAICSRVIIIDCGKLVFNGTPQQLKEKSPHGNEVIVTILQANANEVKLALQNLPQVKEVNIIKEGNNLLTLSINPSAKSDDLALNIQKLLVEHKWEFCELHTQDGKLDEVFRNLTTSDSTGIKEGAA